jgi:hypothetical protein
MPRFVGVRCGGDKTQIPTPLRGDLFATVEEPGAVRRGGDGDDDAWRRIQTIPPLHRMIGLILVGAAKPDYLSAYSKQP